MLIHVHVHVVVLIYNRISAFVFRGGGRGFSLLHHALYLEMSTCSSVISMYTSGSGLSPVYYWDIISILVIKLLYSMHIELN